jgi:hypothetical protein
MSLIMPAIAVVLQILLLLYHQITTWFDFFPFNGVRFHTRKETIGEAGVNFVMMVLPPIGFLFHVPALMKFGVVYYFVLFAVECATWWGPYFFGASAKWAEIHGRMHAPTITILPRRPGYPAPNLEHLVLMMLTLLAAFTTLRSYSIVGGSPGNLWPTALIVSAVFGGGTFYQFVLAGRTKPKTSADSSR